MTSSEEDPPLWFIWNMAPIKVKRAANRAHRLRRELDIDEEAEA